MAPIVAIPLLAKALGFAKGLAGAKSVTSGMMAGVKGAGAMAGLKGQAAGAALRHRIADEGIRRFAGRKLHDAGSTLLKSAIPNDPADAAMIYGPDAAFGLISAAMTPGDLGDKLIAGTSTAVGGSLGGVAGRSLVSPQKQGLRFMADMAGGFAGDSAAMGVSDALLRLKGGGTTPYEKLALEQQEQIQQDALRQLLAGRGYPGDSALAQTGLG